jgi:transposase
VDQGYTGDDAAAQAQDQGIRLEAVKHSDAKKGFVLLPRRWVVERTFGWQAVSGAWPAITNGSKKRSPVGIGSPS